LQLPQDITAKKTALKCCEYPGCDTMFVGGSGRAKYCDEHKKKKYFNELYHSKYKEKHELNNQNQVIQHAFVYPVIRVQRCECCGKKFKIKILPRVYHYPKYCEEHVNEHKRNLYNKNNIGNKLSQSFEIK
jgi:hypothetical protein